MENDEMARFAPTTRIGPIEKDIPIPDYNGKYEFDIMEVGDSFWCEGVKNVMAAASAYVKRTNSDKKFLTRAENGGLRCWRIK
jgi:hypothetical protein